MNVRDLDEAAKLITFYLPQFHPIPENNKAWGEGFTEWTNVTKSKPFYPDHNQPSLPSETGFYDLRVPEVMIKQAELARQYGIHGFCYYYYWFSGRRLLEKPIDMMLGNPDIDMPFCLAWANENWSRRWDGSEHEIIVAQDFAEGWPEHFIDDLLLYFADPRYIRIEDRPLLIIYRPDIIPDLRSAVTRWRARAKEHGIDLYIAACLTFGFDDPPAHGFDAGIEFPPHGIRAREVSEEIEWNCQFEGRAYSYDDAIHSELVKPDPPYTVFRAAMAGWDNTPRRGVKGHLFHGATPEKFETWLSALTLRAVRRLPADRRFVFINAWNEWAEGAHLEPDRKFGRRWLAACARAVRSHIIGGDESLHDSFLEEMAEKAGAGELGGEQQRLLEIAESYRERFRGAAGLTTGLSQFFLGRLEADSFAKATAVMPASKLPGSDQIASTQLTGWIEHPATDRPLIARLADPFIVVGWVCAPDIDSLRDVQCIVRIVPADGGEALVGMARYPLERIDVADAHPTLPREQMILSGFTATFDLRALPPGEYRVEVGLRNSIQTSLIRSQVRVVLS